MDTSTSTASVTGARLACELIYLVYAFVLALVMLLLGFFLRIVQIGYAG